MRCEGRIAKPTGSSQDRDGIAKQTLGTTLAAMNAAATQERETTMNLTDKIRYWRTYRRTVSELRGMSDRQLSDLGIGRSEINHIARQAASV